jgi:carbon starvation protein CstA
VAALFAAVATQIGRTKKNSIKTKNQKKEGPLSPLLFIVIAERKRQNKKNLKLKIALAV